jgi:Eukaryotic translation initiation factor 3 subunit 7 (eIF-3)
MPGTAFRVPEVQENEDGWGPTTLPPQLDGVPYAPFSKGDKVGRVADFTQGGGFGKYGGAVLADCGQSGCRGLDTYCVQRLACWFRLMDGL